MTIGSVLAAAGWWLAPSRCVLCATAGAAPRLDLCVHCLQRLPRLTTVWLPAELGFDRVLSPWEYAYPVDAMLRALKFHGLLAYGRVLGTLLGRCRRVLMPPSPVHIVPLPLHPARFAQRGFNQAAVLAAAAAVELQRKPTDELLIRIRNTRPQSLLDKALRRDNLRSAFRCPRPLAGATVALVDDVLTTGATARAAAAALRAAGATDLELWVAARAT